MAKLFYSLSGEGRGHAARANTLIEDLRTDHEIVVYAPSLAYDMIYQAYYGAENVSVIRIPGLSFQYNSHNRLDYGKSFTKSLDYIANSPGLIRFLCDDIEREKPDLVITDFEPALPRAAEKCHIPYISVNHQHFLTMYDLSSLPIHLRIKASFIGKTLKLFHNRQIKTVISSFYFPPLKKSAKDVEQVGVFINKMVRSLTPVDDGHILVYQRRFIDKNLIKTLSAKKRRVIIYNHAYHEKSGNIEFKTISPFTFLEDLAACSCLISTAGNQLIGEAMYLGKPVIAIPEPDNYEQQINAYFLAQSGAGIDCEIEQINADILDAFIANIPAFRTHIDKDRVPGNTAVSGLINSMLGSNDASIPMDIA